MIANHVQLAAFDWIQVIIFLFVVGGWIVSQVVNAAKGAKPAQPARPQPRPQPRQEAPRPPRDPSTNDEIAEFLRRTSQGQGKRGPADVEVARTPYPATSTPTPRSHRQPEPVVEAEVLTEGTLAEHVASHMVAGRVTEHSEHLTDEISLSDERLEDRLHRTFDHRLGALDQDDLMASDPSPQALPAGQASSLLSAGTLRGMLGTPQGMRTAIVLSEVLERPEHRWS